jgi:FAD/FMN-containing dehydrogenase
MAGDVRKEPAMTALTRSAIDRLRNGFHGELISPGCHEYGSARKVWNGAIDRHPALIARANCTSDVVRAVRFARERGLEVSVRGGGHSVAGHAVADGALMLDLSAMKAIHVDQAATTAAAGPGVLWSELDAATQALGLATTGGVVGSTGIAGLTLGGGIGYLDRLAGLTCDNLLGAEVVTADGEVLQVSRDAHPDLFWALRGGGGNFGVVTSFSYRLHPVSQVYGGLLAHTPDRAVEALQAYREFSVHAPDRLALYAGLATPPSAPFVPEQLRGRLLVSLMPIYFGPTEEAARALAPLLALTSPTMDFTGPMSYQQVQQLTDRLNPPAMHHYYTAEWLRSLDDQTIEALVAAAADAPSPRSLIIIKLMGGAAGRVPADATPFWYRHAAYNLDIHAQWEPGDPPRPHIAWARAARQAAQPASAGGGYVNFIGADQGSKQVRAAYGGNYTRLAQIKAAHDPDNFFHINNNIPPANPAQDGDRGGS